MFFDYDEDGRFRWFIKREDEADAKDGDEETRLRVDNESPRREGSLAFVLTGLPSRDKRPRGRLMIIDDYFLVLINYFSRKRYFEKGLTNRKDIVGQKIRCSVNV